MKFKAMALASFTALGLVACGGGGDGGTSADVPATSAAANYSTGCLKYNGVNSGMPAYEKYDIALSGALTAGSTTSLPTATVAYNGYSDSACATAATVSLTVGGKVTLLADTKTLTNETGSKTGNKGTLLVDQLTMHGITLNFSPLGQSLPFVLINEGSKVYFGNGVREADGYPSSWSTVAGTKL